MKDSLIVTNTGVYELEVYDKDKTILSYGKAYIFKENIEETDIFYLFRGKLHDNSTEPGIYLDENELVRFIEPSEKNRPDYVVYTHLSKVAPGDMLVVLKDKKNIQHVYNESSKLFMPGVEDTMIFLRELLRKHLMPKKCVLRIANKGSPTKMHSSISRLL